MVAVVLAMPRPEEAAQPAAAPADVAFPGDASAVDAATGDEKKVDGRFFGLLSGLLNGGRHHHHHHHGNIYLNNWKLTIII